MPQTRDAVRALNRIANALERIAIAVESYNDRDPLKLMEAALNPDLAADHRDRDGNPIDLTQPESEGDWSDIFFDKGTIPPSERWRFE